MESHRIYDRTGKVEFQLFLIFRPNDPRYKKIPVLHDGSKMSDRACAYAQPLSKIPGSEFGILHVVENIRPKGRFLHLLDLATRKKYHI